MLTPVEADPLEIFQMRSKRRMADSGTGSLDYKSRAVKDFVDHVNMCLGRHGRRLTEEGRYNLAMYTGEIISNAEEHSGIDDWAIVGYLDNIQDEHLSEIAIFNFGATISESFKSLPEDSYAYGIIKPYVDLHASNGYYGNNWTEENFITLLALQGNISSKNKDESGTRGQGTVEMIDFFQAIHQECLKDDASCAKMAILSGSTHILFDGTYQLLKSRGNGRGIIAFNAENDLAKRPDENYVKNLKPVFFPGTVISIRFPMQSRETELAI